MASRDGGKRPVGTDGNDFMHRQKIASQYETRYFSSFFIFQNIFCYLGTKKLCFDQYWNHSKNIIVISVSVINVQST